jgi:hypothetical protein
MTAPNQEINPATRASTRRMAMTNIPKDDLKIDVLKGIAYQVDRTESVPYDNTYLDKIKAKTKKKEINKLRKEIVDEHAPSGMVLDIGCGDMSFINTIHRAYGYDVIPEVVAELKEKSIYRNPIEQFPSDVTAVTMWDSLEHMPEPKILLSKIPCKLFVSIPIIKDIRRVRQSVHYRPNEHYWYFTNNGFINYMFNMDFQCIDHNEHETTAGREDISTYVFRRV